MKVALHTYESETQVLAKLKDFKTEVQRNSSTLFALSSLYHYSPSQTEEISLRLSARWPQAAHGRALVRIGTRKIRNSAVLISGLGRLGNSIIQVLNAIELGKALGTGTFFFFRFDAIGNSPIKLGNLGRLKRIPSFSAKLTEVPDLIWQTEAIYRGGIVFDPCAEEIKQACVDLSKHFGLEPSLIPPNEKICTIHVRGGDIFSENPHPAYGQPPWVYYQQVLESQAWESVVLVSEDSKNPCVDEIVKWCQERHIPLRSVGKDVAGAADAIVKAANLVVSIGTFAPALLLLGGGAQRVYCFGDTASELLCKSSRELFLVRDLGGEYCSAIMGNNWQNTSLQKELMLSYAKSNLSRPTKIS